MVNLINFYNFIGEDVSYVNISDHGLKPFLQESANKTIKWVVIYEAFPSPGITWSKDKPSNVIVNKSSKYIIKNEPKRTTLEIKDLEFSDSGQYFLTITTKDEKQTRSFTLQVQGKLTITNTCTHITNRILTSQIGQS